MWRSVKCAAQKRTFLVWKPSRIWIPWRALDARLCSKDKKKPGWAWVKPVLAEDRGWEGVGRGWWHFVSSLTRKSHLKTSMFGGDSCSTQLRSVLNGKKIVLLLMQKLACTNVAYCSRLYHCNSTRILLAQFVAFLVWLFALIKESNGLICFVVN